MRLKLYLLSATTAALLASCGASEHLSIRCVGYQSVRQIAPQNPEQATDAQIIAGYSFDDDGVLYVEVKNNTSEVMVIDQTKTFFIDTNGKSICYYDPTVRTTSTANTTSNTTGASVNLGSVAGALGIGGVAGTLLGGVNVGGANTAGQTVTNTIYEADVPHFSIGPKGSGRLSKNFQISGIGQGSMGSVNKANFYETEKQSPKKFSVCITYSVDGGETFDKLVTDFYMNSEIIIPVQNTRELNNCLRSIYKMKSDAINEPWWTVAMPNNLKSGYNVYTKGGFINYK